MFFLELGYRVIAHDRPAGCRHVKVPRRSSAATYSELCRSRHGTPNTPDAGPNTLYFTAGINGEADGLFGDHPPGTITGVYIPLVTTPARG